MTIAKVDATANDVPDEIQGFPTIKLYASGKKDSPITYDGPRTVADIAKFIAESGTYKVKVDAPADPDEKETPDAAPAATEEGAGVAEGAASAVKDAASKAAEAVEAAVGGAGDDDIHDEL